MLRLKVSASCPSCGAPFDLLEGANVARCPFCDLPLLFQSQEKILRYYLEPKSKRETIPYLVDRYRKENERSLPKRMDEIKLI
jgi:LSD1 subclass zinc finger protein